MTPQLADSSTQRCDEGTVRGRSLPFALSAATVATMHRTTLLQLLTEHSTIDAEEERSRVRILGFVREQPQCFERTLRIGHVTGSAWLLNRDGSRALLTFHRKLGRWLQLGGHSDGDPDTLAVALREAREESGIEAIAPVHASIFDVDVHRIPARAEEPEHDHYDVRFLLRVAGDEQVRMSDESLGLRWFGAEELGAIQTDESVLRMARKWRVLDVSPRNAAVTPSPIRAT